MKYEDIIDHSLNIYWCEKLKIGMPFGLSRKIFFQ